MRKKIAIIDYGVGNLKSIKKALEIFEAEASITNDKSFVEEAHAVVLPGVGAFPDAISEIKKTGIEKAIKEKPALGICLGMQLFFSKSYEIRETEGLNLIKGEVLKLPNSVKVPHIGWNRIKIKNKKTRLLKGIKDNEFFYFVHSYYCKLDESEEIEKAGCSYGIDLPAVVEKENLFGVQFHPEKSGKAGLKMIKNFVENI